MKGARFDLIIGTILLYAFTCSTFMYAQGTELIIEDSDIFCNPSVLGEQRGKGLIISKESSLNQGITTERAGINGLKYREHIDQNSRYSFKLKAPVIIKDNFSWVLGARYETEKFEFIHPESLEEPLLKALQEKPLKTVGLDSYFLKPFKGNKFLISRVKATLNGDYDGSEFDNRDFLRLSGIAAMGWKLSTTRSFGVGVAASQLFGQTSVYPVLLYRHTFNSRYGLEADLPSSIKIRFTPTPKQFFYFRVNVDGANYKVVPDDTDTPFYLEKSEIRTTLTYEQEIHDWLWAGLSVGHRYNWNFDVSSVRGFSVEPGDKLLDSTVQSTLFYNFNIFIVAPRKMLKK